MIFFETSKSLSSQEILQIEKELNIIFPKEFVSHYLQFNGGYPERDVYTWKNGDTTTVNTFFSIGHHGLGNLETTYKNLSLVEEYLPVSIIPFAVDDGGNFFCISVRKSDFGKIYYFNNDHYNSQDKESAMTFLENKFIDFINNLSSGSVSN